MLPLPTSWQLSSLEWKSSCMPVRSFSSLLYPFFIFTPQLILYKHSTFPEKSMLNLSKDLLPKREKFITLLTKVVRFFSSGNSTFEMTSGASLFSFSSYSCWIPRSIDPKLSSLSLNHHFIWLWNTASSRTRKVSLLVALGLCPPQLSTCIFILFQVFFMRDSWWMSWIWCGAYWDVAATAQPKTLKVHLHLEFLSVFSPDGVWICTFFHRYQAEPDASAQN